MPDKPAGYKLGPDGTCPRCGERHARMHRGVEKITCAGHTWYDRDDERDEGRRRTSTKRDTPRPCRALPAPGLDRCGSHGVNRKQREAAKQRLQEDRVTERARRQLGDTGEPIIDPIAKLCAIAGRAVAFMEALADRVDQLDSEDDRAEARADIAVYGRSIKDAAAVVEAIIRMGIAERMTKQDAQRTDGIVAYIDAVVTELGHNPRDPHIAGVIAQKLELLAS